ncbi:MAG: tRNA 4-thiouridine(8) synthase ThiI [candidate division NC10 bacterium]|nr:tRNA 4-thiouridine(8) synthase ThiI [candidate division NC10 bacterium]
MPCVMVHYSEIGLKGKNQPLFLRRLEGNIRKATAGAGVRWIEARSGRLVLHLGDAADWGVIRERLQWVFGIANYSLALRVGLDLGALKAGVLAALKPLTFQSFKVSTRRAYKQFPMNSEEVNRELGAAILEDRLARVDLERPELTVHVEVLPRDIYYSVQREPGPGGLPVGVSGRVVALLSGGIDSPVAASRLLKRGCLVTFVHFHSVPYLDGASRDKAADLARLLSRYQYESRLFQVPFGEIQREVVAGAPPPLRIVLYRRLMGRIAAGIAGQVQAKALVTGESLGQVASQTLDNLAVIEEAMSLPILRPLIGCDKEEIVQEARRLGTYEISIRPDQDCCRFFVPRHPATFSSLEEVRAAEANLAVARLVQMGLDQAEAQTFTYPEAGGGET